MAGGVTECEKCADDDDGDAHDQKGIFRCVLTGLLVPEPFEEGAHIQHL
jgi:hypothetical protein